MGDRTKIDWCDTTWNPVTGCLHGCEYCYARRIAERFGSGLITGHDHLYVLDKPVRCTDTYEYMRIAGISAGRIQPYPYNFDPTFHRYKLHEPLNWKKPRTIFVCSMADLFGEWVPDEWIVDVYSACCAASQHRYLFLTKNPGRISRLVENGIVMPNTIDWWFGYTIDGKRELYKERPIGRRTFCSVEPILCCPSARMLDQIAMTNWCIIGAETGNRKEKVYPQKWWIDLIVSRCRDEMIPVYMKESLRGIMGADFIQEYPWEV